MSDEKPDRWGLSNLLRARRGTDHVEKPAKPRMDDLRIVVRDSGVAIGFSEPLIYGGMMIAPYTYLAYDAVITLPDRRVVKLDEGEIPQAGAIGEMPGP